MQLSTIQTGVSILMEHPKQKLDNVMKLRNHHSEVFTTYHYSVIINIWASFAFLVLKSAGQFSSLSS